MDRLKELQEAKEVADVLIYKVDNAINSMKKASSWGWIDIFGGGFFSSVFKRDNIEDANNEINDIVGALNFFKSELADIGISLDV